MISQLDENGFEVSHICDALGLSRSAYYQWPTSKEYPPTNPEHEMRPLIHNVFYQHRRRYGARRIALELQSMGYRCSRAKALKMMTQMQVVAIQPKSFKPRTTNSQHRLRYSPNLLADGFQLTRCNEVWVGDLTFIGLRDRFDCAAVLMELFSRKIVGWSIALTMKDTLTNNALQRAIKARQPPPQLIHHTDRGGQYASAVYRSLLHIRRCDKA